MVSILFTRDILRLKYIKKNIQICSSPVFSLILSPRLSCFLFPLFSLLPSFYQKFQVLAEGAAPAGDLSEEVDGVQSCSVKTPGEEEEEEGYDADSESNPEDMANQEEGKTTLSRTDPFKNLQNIIIRSYCWAGQTSLRMFFF